VSIILLVLFSHLLLRLESICFAANTQFAFCVPPNIFSYPAHHSTTSSIKISKASCSNPEFLVRTNQFPSYELLASASSKIRIYPYQHTYCIYVVLSLFSSKLVACSKRLHLCHVEIQSESNIRKLLQNWDNFV
jgi:hypothetical protein